MLQVSRLCKKLLAVLGDRETGLKDFGHIYLPRPRVAVLRDEVVLELLSTIMKLWEFGSCMEHAGNSGHANSALIHALGPASVNWLR